MNKSITSYTKPELEEELKKLKQPKFRAKQILDWLYNKKVNSYDEMTNLPNSLRETLKESIPFSSCKIVNKQISLDGTRKYILRLNDGNLIETVGIPSNNAKSSGDSSRLTVCFSTQVGCPMACAFCATGKEGFTRNLSVGEMVEQILIVEKDMNERVSNAVAMGQGEGFLNYDNLLKSLRIINSPNGLNIGARHITISTCGIAKGIDQLSEEPEQFTLAVSLHSAVQKTRNQLMPKVSGINLSELKESLLFYVEKTNRRISFEYLLLRDINDSEKDLQALKNFCNDLHCHVNLLPVNDIEGSPFKPTTASNIKHWITELERSGTTATLRTSRGSDIDGACGQLKNSFLEK